MTMQYRTIGWLSLIGLLTAGCATSLSSRAQETESLKTQVASLEAQVGDLNQRIEELSQRQTAWDGAPKSKPASQPETLHSKKAAASLSSQQIQTALKAAGFYNGSVDGKLGPQTQEAVKAFQRSRGLHPDGVVGTKTASALAKFLENQPEQ